MTKEINDIKPLIDLVITHLDSKNSPPLQAVDFISWAIFRKYEKNDITFYEIIKEKIIIENKE